MASLGSKPGTLIEYNCVYFFLSISWLRSIYLQGHPPSVLGMGTFLSHRDQA